MKRLKLLKKVIMKVKLMNLRRKMSYATLERDNHNIKHLHSTKNKAIYIYIIYIPIYINNFETFYCKCQGI